MMSELSQLLEAHNYKVETELGVGGFWMPVMVIFD